MAKKLNIKRAANMARKFLGSGAAGAKAFGSFSAKRALVRGQLSKVRAATSAASASAGKTRNKMARGVARNQSEAARKAWSTMRGKKRGKRK